tara:strand:- start:785 stop:1096 length:312 start_codon:yes stop_codon:yes gene_type:complete
MNRSESIARLCYAPKGTLATGNRQKNKVFFARLNSQAVFGRLPLVSDDKEKNELYGESMEMLGEDLGKSNAKLGDEAKNDELGQAAADAMGALLKNKKADAED